MPFELVSQFTEDAFAKEDHICDRPSCKAKIKAGEPCFYVATIDPAQPGHHVCAPCYSQYRKKEATSVRPTCGARGPTNHGGPPGVGTGMSQSHLRPDPQTIQQSVNAAQRKFQHAHYAAEHQCWAKMSYAFAPAETISLAISAVHEGAARKKTKWVQIG
ncbi:hypothetical protein PAXRUDRAFT_29013, partial [Paxillus rubicundulus Ve08.2h10]